MVSPVINMPNTEKHSGVSGIPTQLLVLHSGESPLRGGYAQSLTQWANVPLSQGGPEASWHWFVDPIAIVSMVNAQYAAWHASEANPMSEGFEQSGYARFSRDEWTTPEGMKQLDNLGWLMAQRAIANDIPPVWLTTDQVEAVTKRGNRSIKGLCLHRQIDPETRTDPGNGYPYDLLLDKIKYYMEDEDMALSDEDALKVARAVLDFRVDKAGGVQTGQINLGAFLSWSDANNAAIIKANAAEVSALREVVRQLSIKQGVTIDYDAISKVVAKAVNDDAAARMKS
jgi:hypothetical protein